MKKFEKFCPKYSGQNFLTFMKYIITALFCWISPISLKQIIALILNFSTKPWFIFFLFPTYLPWNPVRVPQRSIGFLPVGPLIVKESVQTPVVVSTKSKLSKSSLNWHMSRKLTKDQQLILREYFVENFNGSWVALRTGSSNPFFIH